jgi:Phospholipid-translocating ATPase N-terminal
MVVGRGGKKAAAGAEASAEKGQDEQEHTQRGAHINTDPKGEGNMAAASAVVNEPTPGQKQSSMKRLWSRIKEIDLDPETAFRRKRPPPCERSIYFNEALPQEAFNHKGRPLPSWTFATNQVLTAKYTIYNFLFKNLLEQFRRVANLFFLREFHDFHLFLFTAHTLFTS